MRIDHRTGGALSRALITAAGLALSVPAFAQYSTSLLVSDQPGVAANQDAQLVNPWGIAFNPTGVVWVNNEQTGVSTLYNGAGVKQSLVVTVPSAPGTPPPGLPTGIVFSGSSNFTVSSGAQSGPSRFIFATLDGTISGWNPTVPSPPTSTQAHIRVNNSASGASYTGLAINSVSAGNRLFAANFAQGRIDTFDGAFAPLTTSGGFSDPSVPDGLTPFNVQQIGGKVFVTYTEAVAGLRGGGPASGGHVSVFDLDGNLERSFHSGGPLSSPWGITRAPASFGAFSNDILIGNLADGRINAFDFDTGAFKGPLTDAGGSPVVIDGLWGLAFGNGFSGQRTDSLFFTAGPEFGAHGLYGEIRAIPAPGAIALSAITLLALRRRR